MKKVVKIAMLVFGMAMMIPVPGHAFDLGNFGKPFGNTGGGMIFGRNIEDQLSIGGPFGGNTGNMEFFKGNIEDQLSISSGHFGGNIGNMEFFKGNIEDQLSISHKPPESTWHQPSWQP